MGAKDINDILKYEALKYDSRYKFQKGNASAYYKALRRGILDDICSHMKKQFRWTEELLRNEALKYNNRSDFDKNSGGAYKTASKMCLLDSITEHMKRQGDIYNRFIYIIKFEDNSVYIGLTYNLEKRLEKHIKKSCNKYVNYLMNNNIKYTFISDNILYNIEDAIKQECLLIDKYKYDGYKVLNIAKGGGLGSNSKKWSEDILKEEALKYDNRISFQKFSNGAYQSAKARGLLDNICSHMNYRFIWTTELLKEEALKYDKKSSFQKGSSGAYSASIRKGILDDVCSHMNRKYKHE